MRPDQEEENRRRREELAAISAMLQDRVEDLAPILLPEGRREGHDWRAGTHGGRSIRLRGAHRGVYRDFSAGGKGSDMLGAIADLLCSGSMRDAITWARAYLGIAEHRPEALELARKKAERRRIQQEQDAARLDAKRRRQAAGLWHGAAPIRGTMAERWLAGRGIMLDRLPKDPGALRFQPKAWCKERKGEHPAMVSALFRFGDPALIATHRTFLAEEAGRVVKAPVATVRSILGSWPGGVIPLTRGETGRPWSKISEGEVLALGEGIEEGLSIALVRPAWRVGAVGFVGNFGQIRPPVWCHVMLCINNDPEGSEAWRAIFGDPGKKSPGAVRELEAAGHVVRVLRPPEDFKDWNDLLNGKRRGRG